MATLAQHTAARDDRDLIARIRAAAEQVGIPRAHVWAEEMAGIVVAADIGETTVADVYAYAVGQKAGQLSAGADPSFVTDAQIQAAVAVVKDAQ